jgi:hypothetical protein
MIGIYLNLSLKFNILQKKIIGESFLMKTGTSTPPLYIRIPIAIQIPYYKYHNLK